MNIFYLLSIVSCAVCYNVSIKWIYIPRYVLIGNEAYLHCDFQSDHEIYSLEWYYGRYTVFYRYRPWDVNPIISYGNRFFSVDELRSDKGTVLLTNISSISIQNLTCEVTGEKPYFETTSGKGIFEIIQPPKSVHLITNSNNICPEQLASVWCSSISSSAITDLTFTINDIDAPNSWISPVVVNTTETIHNGYWGIQNITNVHRLLRFPIKNKFIVKGKVNIKCNIKIRSVYSKTIRLPLSLKKSVCKEITSVAPTISSLDHNTLNSTVVPTTYVDRIDFNEVNLVNNAGDSVRTTVNYLTLIVHVICLWLFYQFL